MINFILFFTLFLNPVNSCLATAHQPTNEVGEVLPGVYEAVGFVIPKSDKILFAINFGSRSQVRILFPVTAETQKMKLSTGYARVKFKITGKNSEQQYLSQLLDLRYIKDEKVPTYESDLTDALLNKN